MISSKKVKLIITIFLFASLIIDIVMHFVSFGNNSLNYISSIMTAIALSAYLFGD